MNPNEQAYSETLGMGEQKSALISGNRCDGDKDSLHIEKTNCVITKGESNTWAYKRKW